MPPKITVLISPTSQPTLAKPFGMARQPVPKMHLSSSMKASWSLKDKYNSVIDKLYTYIYIVIEYHTWLVHLQLLCGTVRFPWKNKGLRIIFSSVVTANLHQTLQKQICSCIKGFAEAVILNHGLSVESIGSLDYFIYIYIDIYKYIYIYCLLYSFTEFSAPTQLPIMQIK